MRSAAPTTAMPAAGAYLPRGCLRDHLGLARRKAHSGVLRLRHHPRGDRPGQSCAGGALTAIGSAHPATHGSNGLRWVVTPARTGRATTVVPVTGPQYDPGSMHNQIPDLRRICSSTAWLTTARTSDGCHHGSLGRGPATSVHQADNDRQIKKLGTKADRVELEALTAMRSRPPIWRGSI